MSTFASELIGEYREIKDSRFMSVRVFVKVQVLATLRVGSEFSPTLFCEFIKRRFKR